MAAAVAGRNVGKAFSAGEGEGRNACFLASLPGSEGDSSRRGLSCWGFKIHAVHSIDASEIGVAKTLRLASERGVEVHASQGEECKPLLMFSHWPQQLSGFLEDLHLPPNSIDTFVSIFCHTVPASSLHSQESSFIDLLFQEVRSRVHRMAQDALRPGGMFILEAYTPQQIVFGTGGPKSEDLLLTESQLKSDFDRMQFVILQEIERDVREGSNCKNMMSICMFVCLIPLAFRDFAHWPRGCHSMSCNKILIVIVIATRSQHCNPAFNFFAFQAIQSNNTLCRFSQIIILQESRIYNFHIHITLNLAS